MESYIQDLQDAVAIYESITPITDYQLMFEEADAAEEVNKKKTEGVFAKLKAAVKKVIDFLKGVCSKIATAVKNLFISKENQQIQREYDECIKEYPELGDVKFEVEDFKAYVKNVKMKQAKLEAALAKKDDAAIETGKKDLADALDETMQKIGVSGKEITKFFNDSCRMIRSVSDAAGVLLDETTSFASNLDKNKDYNGVADAIKATGYSTMKASLLGKEFAKHVNKGSNWFTRSAREVYRNMKDLAAFCKSHGKDPYAKAALKAMMLKSPIARTGAAVSQATLGYQLTMWGHGVEGAMHMAKASTYTNKASRNAQIEANELFAAGGRIASTTKDKATDIAKEVKKTVNAANITKDKAIDAVTAVKNFVQSGKNVSKAMKS